MTQASYEVQGQQILAELDILDANLDQLPVERLAFVRERLAAIEAMAGGVAAAAASEVNETGEARLGNDDMRLRRQAWMAGNYHTFFEGITEGTTEYAGMAMRKRQPEIFLGIDRCLAEGPDDQGVIKFGLRSVPNTGKTFISVMTAKAAGVGQVPPGETEPARMIYLVPWRRIGHQAIGDVRRGFKAFAPELQIGQYFDEVKEMGDVTIMTYRSLMTMGDEEFEEFARTTSFVVGDEIHRAYGPVISDRMRRLINRPGMTFMGMSATTEFNEEHNLQAVYGVERMAADIGFREGIEDGISNGAQVLLLSTGSEVRIAGSKGIQESDIQHLIGEKSRNDLAADIIQVMAEEGRTGIVKCVRGQESLHARVIAELANGRMIVDPATGEQRPLRVLAVGNFQSRNENDKVLAEFAAGKVDALTYTKYLLEGYDEDRVEYIVDTEPSTSQVDIDQEFGRGSRLKDKLTLCFQFIDKYSGRDRRQIRTWLHTLGEEIFNPSMVIGKPGRASSNKRLSGTGRGRSSDVRSAIESTAFNYLTLPKALREAVESAAGKTIAELTIIAKDYEPAPDDWMNVEDLSLREHFSQPTVLRILESRGIECGRGPRSQLKCPPNTEELLSGYDPEMADPKLLVSLADIRRGRRLSAGLFSKLVEELGITPLMMRTNTKTKRHGWHITHAERERLEAYLDEQFPPVDPEVDAPVTSVADELYRHRTHIRVVAGQLGIPLYTRFGPTRRETSCMTHEQAELIKQELGVLVPGDAVLTEFLAERVGLELGELRRVVAQSPFAGKLEGGKLRGGDYVDWLRESVVDEFLAWYEGERADRQPSAPSMGRGTEREAAPEQPVSQPASPTQRPAKPARRDDGAMHAGAIAEVYGLTERQVRAIIGKLTTQGALKEAPKPVVRALKSGQQVKFYKGAALSIISQAVEAALPES